MRKAIAVRGADRDHWGQIEPGHTSVQHYYAGAEPESREFQKKFHFGEILSLVPFLSGFIEICETRRSPFISEVAESPG